MSSITVGNLKNFLEHYPDDYEVIMYWKWKEWDERNKQSRNKESIAYINGIEKVDSYKEVRLLN